MKYKRHTDQPTPHVLLEFLESLEFLEFPQTIQALQIHYTRGLAGFLDCAKRLDFWILQIT